MGKKSGPKAPAAPDPMKVAEAQSLQNKNAAVAQANLNRIDQYTPEGSLTYEQIGTNADGTPRYKQTQQYSPEQQVLYDQQNNIAQQLGGFAEDSLGRVQETTGKDFNFNGSTAMRTSASGGELQNGLDYSGVSAMPTGDSFDATSKAAADAVYKQAASRLDPQYAQEEAKMRARLAASGITENSQAYTREMDNFGRRRTDAYDQANYSSIGAGLAAQNQGWQQALAARQQGVGEINTQGAFHNEAQGQRFNQDAQNVDINNTARSNQNSEASYLRDLPLNDIAKMLGTGGGAQGPEFNPVSQVGVAAPDYQGLVQNNYNAAMEKYKSDQANRGGMLGSIFGAAGSLGAAAIMSDRRLKTNVHRISTLANGLATYVYNYIGHKAIQFGVMAQEALGVVPEAVGVADNGYMYVDYRKVW